MVRSILLLSLCLNLNLRAQAEPTLLRADAASHWSWEYPEPTGHAFRIWWGEIAWATWTNFALVDPPVFYGPPLDPFPIGTNKVTLTALVIGEDVNSDPSPPVIVHVLTNSVPPVGFTNLLTVALYQGRPFIQATGLLQHATSLDGPFTNAAPGWFPPGDSHFWTVPTPWAPVDVSQIGAIHGLTQVKKK